VNIILGFGDTEKQFEEKLENQMWDFVAGEFSKESETCFTDNFINKIKKYAKDLAEESQKQGDRHKASANYPDRYTYFWCYTLGDCNHIVFIISFHHINRRHALSPDGWGLMQSKRVFDVYNYDVEQAKKVS
jgi:hypothetical protein